MKKIGIITYAFPHLKTEQIILSIINKIDVQDITVFALPFKPRPKREVFLNHRPLQENSISPSVLCEAYNIEYRECLLDTDITDECGIYLITGAGILSNEMAKGKKIINAHPGIIPAARGLDAFKWSIYNMIPLGVTLHYIDQNVDMGEIISIIPTPVFITDSLETLARRHYENEIAALASYDKYLNRPNNDFKDINKRVATKRMQLEKEAQMADVFDEYKEKFAMRFSSIN